MSELELIISIVAGLVLVASSWMIVYFAIRIFTDWHIKRNLGDMPTDEEIQALYEQNNSIIRYDNHSPIDKQ